MTEELQEKRKAKKPPKTDWEDEFAKQLEVAGFTGLRAFTRQYQGIPNRRYKFDFAGCFFAGMGKPVEKIAIEIEGGSWGSSSRHTSGVGFRNDCKKYNLATKEGWRVFRFTSDMVRDKSAIEFMKEVFGDE